MKLTMHIRMCADWHVGTGTGRHGGVDRLIARDPNGLPYVPGSTIRNLWRDAAEMLARGLDGPEGGAWAGLVRRLFGSQPSTERHAEAAPVGSLIAMGDALISEALRARLTPGTDRAAWLREALTYVKPGVAIDPDTGAALDEHLHLDEVAVGGLLLVADADVALAGHTEAATDTVYWFLCGAACLIERLGGKRRRGLGACEVLLTRASDERSALPGLAELSRTSADYLQKASAPTLERPTASRAAPADAERAASPDAAAADGWHAVPIAIELHSPLIVADEIQGNVVTTLDHIPGSMLLPVVAAAAQRSGLQGIGERIARSELRVLPATVEIAKQRSLPVPLDWGKPKDAPSEDAFAVFQGILRAPTRETQVKGLRRGYVAPASDGRICYREKVRTTLRTRNVVADELQTPTEDIGGVFSYEAIAVGQVLRSIVWLRGAAAEADALKAELTRGREHVERLGRAKQVGYGRVSITAGAEEKRIEERNHYLPPALDGFLVVWLETDALLPSPDLAGTTTLEALADAIAVALYRDGSKSGRSLFDLSPDGKDDNAEGADAGPRSRSSVAFLRTRRIQTWQARWGLPRPSLTAVQVGSIAKLRLRDGVTIGEEQCQTLERDGIGERRAEGFGVVRVNDATVTTPQTVKPDRADDNRPQTGSPAPGPAEGADLTEAEAKVLSAITERAWKRRIIARAEAVMGERKKRDKHLGFVVDRNKLSPAMSQLGALRSRLPAEEASDAEDAAAWIKRQRSKASGRSRQPANDWLTKVERIISPQARQQGQIWGILELPTDMPAPPGGTTDSMRRKLWAFAVTNTLLIAMRHHKRAGEKAKAGKRAAGAPSTQEAAP